MHGFLNINKPVGPTSHDVVARLRRLAGRGVKVGHAGTLDPAAAGVLPVALGQTTRLIEYLADSRKGYRGLLRLGVTTATDDAEGTTLEVRAVPPLSDAAIEAAAAGLRGEIMQVPPIYSALRQDGQRLYDLARAGVAAPPPPRPVVVYRLEWRRLGPDLLELEVECGKGTYIRSLARDLGAALGVGGHLAGLTRTFVGPFDLASALELDGLEPGLEGRLLPPDMALAGWPELRLDASQARRVINGLPLGLPGPPGERARAYGPEGALLAVLRRASDGWRPEKVLSGGRPD